MVVIYEKIRGVHLNINWGAKAYSAGQIMKPFVGKTLPGWEPSIDFEAGLKKIYC